jgi:hypothetical protein
MDVSIHRPVVVLRLALLLTVLLGWTTSADVVHLKSGGTLEGAVRRGEDGKVTVRQGDGAAITVAAEDVARIEKRRSPHDELTRRLESAPKGEVEPLIEMLVWARDKRLHKGVKEIARRILEVDPHQELARSALGYVVFENRWIRRSELKARGGLVRFRGEWISRVEKEKRHREELRKELEVDLKLLSSDNPHIRQLSQRKLRRVLTAKDPLVREVLGEHLLHPQEEFRMLALAVLAQFPARDDESPDRVSRVASTLHELALREESQKVMALIHTALSKFAPRVSFHLALRAAQSSPGNPEGGLQEESRRERLPQILHSTLRTELVPALILGLRTPDRRTHAPVLSVLRRVFQVDLGYDVAAWQRHWEANRKRYRDAE